MSRRLSLIRVKSCFLYIVLMLFVCSVNATSQVNPSILGVDSLPYTEGKVLSIQKGGGYTFVHVQLANSEKVFLAFTQPEDDIEIGKQITWDTTRLAVDYHSRALQQTFSTLYMATFKQIGIEHGVIESIQSIGTKAYVLVKNNQTETLLVVDKNHINPEFLKGTQIEWQRSKTQPYSLKSSDPKDSPITVKWARISDSIN